MPSFTVLEAARILRTNSPAGNDSRLARSRSRARLRTLEGCSIFGVDITLMNLAFTGAW